MRLYERTPGWAAHQAAGAHAGGCAGGAERERAAARLCSVSAMFRLFVAGFFARSFARKLIDIDYHIAMGGNAYSSLADTLQRSLSGRCVAGRLCAARAEISGLGRCAERSQRDVLSAHRCRHPAPLRNVDENRQPARARIAAPVGRAAGRGGRRAPRALDGMVLRGLQTLLGRLYDVELRYDVYDFLVTDRRAVAGCGQDRDQPATWKKNCCWRNRPTAPAWRCISTRKSCAAWRHADPHRALTEDNLADYCTALEGVSHFVYSTWRLERDLPVSLLELETQAEVDKYAVTVFLLAGQKGAMVLPGASARAAVRPRQLRCAPRAP